MNRNIIIVPLRAGSRTGRGLETGKARPLSPQRSRGLSLEKRIAVPVAEQRCNFQWEDLCLPAERLTMSLGTLATDP